MYLPPSSSQSLPSTPSPINTQCGFAGNNDIYGIGIRIGIYAQILAVWFANYFLFSEAQVLRDSVSVFSVALLVVALIYAANPADVYAVEGFVLLQILAWACMMGVRAKSSYSKGTFSRGSLLRRVICDTVNLISVCLHVWFWWSGLDRMKKTECGTWLMMYVVRTSMFGWARKVMKAMSLFVLICTVYWVAVEFSRPWMFWRLRNVRLEFEEAVGRWEKMRVAKEEAQMHQAVIEDDVSQRSVAHDGCSKYSCDRCSPTQSDFGLDEENIPGLSTSETRIEESKTCKHNSQTVLAEIGALSPSTQSQPPSLTHQLNLEPNPDFAILRQVYEAELYILNCIAASPYQQPPDGKPLAFSIIFRSILSPNKYPSTRVGKLSTPSWLQCHIQTWKLGLTFRVPPQTFAIYSHLRQSRLLDPLNGPFQIHAALTYSCSGIPWPCVTLASTLLLTAPSTPKKVWLGWYYASLDLLIHVVVILQLEFTLHWNNVSGLSGLWTSLGQLVPFIIGVGGLGLVLSRWIVKIWVKERKLAGGTSGWEKDGHGGDEMEAKGGETFGLENGTRKGYARWKAEYEAVKGAATVSAITAEESLERA